MLIIYFVKHSTVTIHINGRLINITMQNLINIMRTLNNNQLTATLKGTKTNIWNTKRRFK